MEQEAAESCWLKLSLILIFSGSLIPALHLHTCLILPHSFIAPLAESAPKVSTQAGFGIQTPELLPGPISSCVFVKRLFLKKPSQREQMLTPCCILKKAEKIPEANPFCDPGAEFCPVFTQQLHHDAAAWPPRGLFSFFPKQRRQSKETLQAKFLHTKCSSPKGVMKA